MLLKCKQAEALLHFAGPAARLQRDRRQASNSSPLLFHLQLPVLPDLLGGRLLAHPALLLLRALAGALLGAGEVPARVRDVVGLPRRREILPVLPEGLVHLISEAVP